MTPGARVRVVTDHVFADGGMYLGREGIVLERGGAMSSIVELGDDVEQFWNHHLVELTSEPEQAKREAVAHARRVGALGERDEVEG